MAWQKYYPTLRIVLALLGLYALSWRVTAALGFRFHALGFPGWLWLFLVLAAVLLLMERAARR